MLPGSKNDKAWKVYGYWVLWISLLFFTIYPLSNWITSLREAPLHVYFKWELSIPFVPWFIWFYLSFYLTFILPPFFLDAKGLTKLGKVIAAGTILGGIIFLIFPAVLGFDRVVPDGTYAALYEGIFKLDKPHNMFPSLHILYTGAILYSIFIHTSRRWIRILSVVWFTLVALSTLLVHQHHIFDVLLGAVMVLLLNYFIKE